MTWATVAWCSFQRQRMPIGPASPPSPLTFALMHELLAGSVNAGDSWMNITVGDELKIPPTIEMTAAPVLKDPNQSQIALESNPTEPPPPPITAPRLISPAYTPSKPASEPSPSPSTSLPMKPTFAPSIPPSSAKPSATSTSISNPTNSRPPLPPKKPATISAGLHDHRLEPCRNGMFFSNEIRTLSQIAPRMRGESYKKKPCKDS